MCRYIHICIYIYRERERKRDKYTIIYLYTYIILLLVVGLVADDSPYATICYTPPPINIYSVYLT